MQDYFTNLDKDIDSLNSKKTNLQNKTNFKKESKNFENKLQEEIKWKFISTFPETKFYLPTLRDGYTRYIPIGWNNETWAKNMWMVQYENDLLLKHDILNKNKNNDNIEKISDDNNNYRENEMISNNNHNIQNDDLLDEELNNNENQNENNESEDNNNQ